MGFEQSAKTENNLPCVYKKKFEPKKKVAQNLRQDKENSRAR